MGNHQQTTNNILYAGIISFISVTAGGHGLPMHTQVILEGKIKSV